MISRSRQRKRTERASSTSRSAPPKRMFRQLSYSKAPYMRSSAITNPAVGLGMSVNTVLRTSFFYNATSAATGIFTGTLKPGSCYDPAGTLADIQPQMYDQFASLYRRYKVNWFRVKVKVTGAAGGANCLTWAGAMYPSVDSTPTSNYQGAASQQFAKTTSGGFQIVNGVGTGTEGKYLEVKMRNDRVVGDRGADSFGVGGLIADDPAATQYALLNLFLQANASAVSSWVLEIDIWQHVTFSQKKNAVDS